MTEIAKGAGISAQQLVLGAKDFERAMQAVGRTAVAVNHSLLTLAQLVRLRRMTGAARHGMTKHLRDERRRLMKAEARR